MKMGENNKVSDNTEAKQPAKPITKMDHRLKKAIPYFIYCCLYVVYFEYLHPESTSMKVPFKAIPMVYLCILVKFTPLKDTRYNRATFFAFIFSLSGDGCLAKPEEYLVHAFFSYAHSHTASIVGFGFRPIALNIGTIVVPLGLAMYAYLSPGLVGALRYMVATYSAILCLMLWRCLARVYYSPHAAERPLSGKVLSVFGVLFVILSNFTLAVDIFLEDKLNHMGLFFAVPHYLGQLCLALSAL